MKNYIKLLFLLSFLCCSGISVIKAQDLISADNLSKVMNNPSLVIISGEAETEYNKVHIRNAINIPYDKLHKPGNIEGLLITPAEIAKMLGEKGVTENSMIVVYDEGSGRYAGRLYFVLKYLGAGNVKMLDGGMEAWKAGRKPVTKNPTIVKAAKFTPKVNNSIMGSMQEASAAAGNNKVVLVDARAKGEFEGREEGSKGHLPGAVNIEFKELLDAKGNFKSKAELEKVYAAKGVSKDKTVIIYCSTGVRAGVHFLALTTTLGYPNVKVYDGGYNEFVSANGSKIVK